MPSLAEGLSLPLLDAWANGLVTIGSRGSVAEEIIANEDLLFDPLSSVSISQQIQRYLENPTEWMDALVHCKRRARDFSWGKTAKLTMSAIENL
jgi:glycosyltransferase involved in cell wall biosynthesis